MNSIFFSTKVRVKAVMQELEFMNLKWLGMKAMLSIVSRESEETSEYKITQIAIPISVTFPIAIRVALRFKKIN